MRRDHHKAEAKASGLKRYFTGKLCQYGHVSERRVSDGRCVACCQARRARSDSARLKASASRSSGKTRYFGKVCEKHPELGGLRKRNDRNCVECARASVRAYRATPEGLEKNRQAARDYYWRPEGFEERRVRHRENWKKAYPKHRDKYIARARLRALSQARRMPAWTLPEDFTRFYRLAQDLRDLIGVPYHVDHHFPLQGENVSGLHVPGNLVVCDYETNLKKHNAIGALTPDERLANLLTDLCNVEGGREIAERFSLAAFTPT